MIDDEPCEAIILRYTNYGEADRIVSLLTKEHGVYSAFARNARNSRRRFGGALQPFNRIRVIWQQRRRAGMPQLAEIELLEAATPLVTDLDALALAAYGCELVSVLLPEEQPVDDLYRIVVAFLSHLPEAESFAVARLLLELRLLELAGLLPHIGHCACCWQPLQDDLLRFDGHRGGTVCPRCAPDGVGVPVASTTLGSLVRLLRVEATQFAGIRLSDETLQQGGAIMRHVLNLNIGRTLKSEQFLNQLQQAL